MPNEIKEKWDYLKEAAQDAGLPAPTIEPGIFEGRWMIDLGDYGWSSDTIPNAMSKAKLWIDGYSARMEAEQKAVDTSVEIDTIKEASQRIIDGKGLGGPSDHILLAKALLALGENND